MEVREISDKNIWEDFLSRQKEKTFLQSWNWGDFQIKQENKIWRLGIYDGDRIVLIALVVKIAARRGTFLLIQHLLETNEEVLQFLSEELKELGRSEGADFIRIAPLWADTTENLRIFKDLGFKKSPMHASAYEATWKLNITIPEEELLKNMRKTTRYLIRQTEKNPDISIEKSLGADNLKVYQELNREVSKRQKFAPFSDEYIKNEFESFSDGKALWIFGKYKGEVAAGALVIFWSGIGFYHQAASVSKYAKFSIPYLLQWEAIKEAKNRGCILYDFWGYTDPQKHPGHPWAGPTLFKMGFGGYAKEYLKTQDLPLSPKYRFIYFFEQLRKIKRGF